MAQNLFLDTDASLEHLREAVEILERAYKTARRVLGGQHPQTEDILTTLCRARLALSRGRGLGIR